MTKSTLCINLNTHRTESLPVLERCSFSCEFDNLWAEQRNHISSLYTKMVRLNSLRVHSTRTVNVHTLYCSEENLLYWTFTVFLFKILFRFLASINITVSLIMSKARWIMTGITLEGSGLRKSRKRIVGTIYLIYKYFCTVQSIKT